MSPVQIIRNPIAYIICIIVSIFTSCVNEKFEYNPFEDSGIIIEGDCITFDIILDNEISTKSSDIFDGDNHSGRDQVYDEGFENYIDIRSKLRIFFFTTYGDFIFGATESYVFETSNDQHVRSWNIILPLNIILDSEGFSYDTEKIKSYLRNNKFKIAVLANWPNNGDLLWGWRNSVLNPNADEIKNINDIHHIYDDPVYKRHPGSYGFAMKNSTYMGMPSEWVRMRDIKSGWKNEDAPSQSFHTKDEANDWVRKFWDPTISRNDERNVYRDYQYLWYLWDLDAAFNSDEGNYSRYNNISRWPLSIQSGIPGNKWGKEWFDRNGKTIKSWLKNSPDNNGNLTSNWKEENNPLNKSALEYIAGENCKLTTIEQTGVGELTGISLSRGNKDKGAFKFGAQISGDLIIRCSSSIENEESEIAVKIGNNEYIQAVKGLDADEIILKEIRIDSDPEDIYIYCHKGNIVLYSIEYICGRYLYSTDREGIMPSEDTPIPMYGIREFEPMSIWPYGTTYDVSKEQNRNIWLLRSIAKVEVYVPQRFGKISQIYMRNLNSSGRCEPIDVETDTKDLWDEIHNTKNKNLLEIKRLMNYGQAYDSQVKNEDQYASWLKWFYGSWTNTYWKNSRNLKDGIWEADNTEKSGWALDVNSEDNYPKVFNTYITQTDFAHFTYGGAYDKEGELYDRYVMYIPEKYMDDPSIIGDRSSDPNVVHIEYRFEEKGNSEDNFYHNSQTNLEDNDCYRIYFTNYSSASGLDEEIYPVNSTILSVDKNGFQEYEKTENIKKHWPIIRNHIYQFFLGGSGPEIHEVHVTVKDWGYDNSNNKEVEW